MQQDTEPETASSARWGPRSAAAVVALVWCGLAARFARAFVSDEAWTVSDDVYVSACAARSLVEGHGPVWYAGAPAVEGFSNPLWVALLAVIHALPGFHEDRLGGFVLAANLALLCGLAFACAGLLARAGFRGWGWLLAFALATPALPYFAAEGFEVVLVALLAVLAFDAAWREAPVRFALLAGLGVWTRMDFPVLVVLPGLWLVARTWGRPELWRGLALGTAMVAALELGRVATFGEWLPNTAVLKTQGWPLAQRLARGLAQNAWAWPSALGLVAAAIALSRAARPRTALGLGCVAVFAAALVYSTWIGGDFLWRRAGWDRFTAPALPLLVVGLCLVLDRGLARPAQRVVAGGLVLALLAVPVLATSTDRRLLDRRLVNFTIEGGPQRWSQGWRGLGRAYRAVSLPGATMAVCAAGAIVYFSHRGGVDLLGKMDPTIAALDVSGPAPGQRCWRDWPGHNKEDVARSFALHEPDFSQVPPPAALRDRYRPVRYDGHEFWVRRGTPYARWDRL